jgi:hypothetical protein
VNDNYGAEWASTFVDAEMIWGTPPTLIAALLHAPNVQEVVTVLSKLGCNDTATRLYNAWQEQRKALA